jgi:hypothetical protein
MVGIVGRVSKEQESTSRGIAQTFEGQRLLTSRLVHSGDTPSQKPKMGAQQFLVGSVTQGTK